MYSDVPLYVHVMAQFTPWNKNQDAILFDNIDKSVIQRLLIDEFLEVMVLYEVE